MTVMHDESAVECTRRGRNILNLNRKCEHKSLETFTKGKKKWSHEKCNHYYQKEGRQDESWTENNLHSRCKWVDASPTLPWQCHQRDKVSVLFEPHQSGGPIAIS